jgi:ABC-type arginine transport system permease subunit
MAVENENDQLFSRNVQESHIVLLTDVFVLCSIRAVPRIVFLLLFFFMHDCLTAASLLTCKLQRHLDQQYEDCKPSRKIANSI